MPNRAVTRANKASAQSNCTLLPAWRTWRCCARSVGAIGTFEDLDFDAVADLRLAVDEVCTRLIRSATPDATLVVVVDPRDDELVVEASAACDTHDVVAPGSFSWHVLTSLADDVQTFHDGRDPDESGSVFGITLTARRAASTR